MNPKQFRNCPIAGDKSVRPTAQQVRITNLFFNLKQESVQSESSDKPSHRHDFLVSIAIGQRSETLRIHLFALAFSIRPNLPCVLFAAKPALDHDSVLDTKFHPLRAFFSE